MFAAFQHALNKVDDDRVTTIILVTDAVTNTGVIDPSQFERLLKEYDIRFFGFLLGNSANWPLMRILSETTGGYYAGVSNSDDIIGQIMLAKSKITYEALHDARLRVRGIKTDALTDKYLGKIYRGEQLVIFGRYENGGKATIELATALSGEDKSYSTTVEFPEVSTDHPELERLWAMQQIEIIEKERDLGREEESEANSAIESLGVEYQLVTDRTSMLLLSDEKFSEYGISRRNKERVAREATAFQARRAAPARNYRVDQAQPMYPSAPGSTRLSENAFHITQGGGAVAPLTGGAALLIAGALGARLRRRKEEEVVAGDNT